MAMTKLENSPFVKKRGFKINRNIFIHDESLGQERRRLYIKSKNIGKKNWVYEKRNRMMDKFKMRIDTKEGII